MKKKSPTSKSRASKASGNIVMATKQMKQIALKSMVSSVVPHCPKEILVEISKFLNMIYPKIKDHCLNTVMSNDTVKRRELAIVFYFGIYHIKKFRNNSIQAM